MFLIRTALFFGCALCLMAQSDESSPQAGQDYGGPAILTRGQLPRSTTAAPIGFRPHVGLSGIYDSGLLPVSVDSQGQIPTPGLFGVQLDLGLYGYHAWKKTTLGLDYRGNFRHYSKKTYYDGTDDILSLVLTHQPSKHVIFSMRNSAGIYSQNYFIAGLGAFYPNYQQLPQNDLFDNRAFFLGTSADVIYQRTARLSFDAGGEGNLIRRRSTALYGMTSGSARGDLQYRLRRHTTVGLDYRFTRFEFTKGFGNTYINSLGVNYATQLTRHLQFAARIGGARVESANLARVPIDPAIAVILGQPFGIQAVHHLNYTPDIMGRLTETFRRSDVYVSYTNSVNPGNGVYLTSRMESVIVGYSYTGLRYWNFGINGNYSRLTAMIQSLGTYDSYGGGAGVTREIRKSLHAVLQLDLRHYSVARSTGSQDYFRHDQVRVSLGFTWSPGDVPLALW